MVLVEQGEKRTKAQFRRLLAELAERHRLQQRLQSAQLLQRRLQPRNLPQQRQRLGRHDAPSRQGSPVSRPRSWFAARFFEPREMCPAQPPFPEVWLSPNRPGRTNSIAQLPGRARSGAAKPRETGAR